MSDDRPPSLWADILLTLWVAVVGVIFFGGYFIPAIGAQTPAGAAFYALMLLASVLVVAFRYLRRTEDTRKKPGK